MSFLTRTKVARPRQMMPTKVATKVAMRISSLVELVIPCMAKS